MIMEAKGENKMSAIGREILNQINTLDRRAMMAWGAKDIVIMSDGLKFKTSGMVKKKCYVHIQYLAHLDLYQIDFARIRNLNLIIDHTIPMVFCENLVEHIDSYVG